MVKIYKPKKLCRKTPISNLFINVMRKTLIYGFRLKAVSVKLCSEVSAEA